MQWYHNLKMGTKIISLLLMMAVFMGIVGSCGLYFTNKMSSGMNDVYKDYLLPVKWLNATRGEARAVEADVLEILNPGTDNSKIQKLQEDILARTSETEKVLTSYEQTNLEPYEKERITALKESLRGFRLERQKAIDLAINGKKVEGFAYYNQNAAAHSDNINKLLKELAEFNAKRAEDINEGGKKDAAFATRTVIVVSLFALVISLLLGWMIARSIARRLQSVVMTLQKVADGDLAQTMKVTAEDEIGEIGHALNSTTKNLRNLVAQVLQSAELVAASSEELTASAEQSAQATTQVAATISEVANGSEEQVSTIGETACIIEQMSAGIQQAAANANTVASMSDKTAEAARKGGDAVDSAVAQMNNIEMKVSRSAQVVTKLGDRSQEIGAIVDTISGIAGQTNLLALNAAIEAARAGEQGRGFAVVAEEVRKLAEQSQEAAKQIATMIREIQSDTDQAVQAMNEGTREVEVGTGVVNSAGHSFKEIVKLVQAVSEQVREISAATQQMASGSQQVVTSVHQINKISKDIAGQTQTVSAATEEQAASMEEIAASSQSLSKMAEDLQNAVRIFKV